MTRMYLNLILVLVPAFTTIELNAQTSLKGTTYSYTDNNSGVTSYFTFISSTDVAWYLGSPSRFMFPIGYGEYNNQYRTITFSNDKPSHKKISIYRLDSDIVFRLTVVGNQTTMRLVNNDECLSNFYNNSEIFTVKKEPYNLTPDSYLVGTSWLYESYGEHREKVSLYFKSMTEVLIDGESHLYMCLDNMVSIKSGDNLGDENLVGTFNTEIMYLYRDGLSGADEDDNNFHICLKRVE